MRKTRSLHPDCEMMEDRLVMSTVPGHPTFSGSAMIDFAKAKPKPKPKPPAPTFKLTATASTTQVQLSWTKVPGATKYLVEELVNGQSVTRKVKNKFTATTFFSLTPNTQYTFEVMYVKGGRKHLEASTPVRTLPLPEPPSAPNDLTAKAISSSKILLKWTPVTSVPPLIRYDVYGLNIPWASPGWQYIGNVPPGDNEAIVNGLYPGTNYSFYLVAVNPVGATLGNFAPAKTLNA
jgi:Fibronectin type III domain